MRGLGRLSDRMLAVVAPRVRAQAACCNLTYYTIPCYCSGGKLYEKTCYTNCCESGCGTCYNSGKTCS